MGHKSRASDWSWGRLFQRRWTRKRLWGFSSLFLLSNSDRRRRGCLHFFYGKRWGRSEENSRTFPGPASKWDREEKEREWWYRSYKLKNKLVFDTEQEMGSEALQLVVNNQDLPGSGSGKLPGYPWGSRRGRRMRSVATWLPELSVLSGFGDTEN